MHLTMDANDAIETAAAGRLEGAPGIENAVDRYLSPATWKAMLTRRAWLVILSPGWISSRGVPRSEKVAKPRHVTMIRSI